MLAVSVFASNPVVAGFLEFGAGGVKFLEDVGDVVFDGAQVAMGPGGMHDGRSAGATAIKEDPV